jgi:hypothetical protein
MSWNKVLERLQDDRCDSDAPSPFHFERLEPRILLSADFLPGFSDSDSSNQDQHLQYSPDLQPLLAFLSSPLDKQTHKDGLALLPEPLKLDSLADAYRFELNLDQSSNSLIDDLSILLVPDAIDSSARFEIIIVDAATPDYQQLINDVQAGSDDARYEVYVLEANSDGLDQISDILQEQRHVDAVHIISHGDDGKVKLGNAWLDASNLDEYAELIAGWNHSFDTNADLLIYGCNLASSGEGVTLIQRLANLTGTDVAASDDLTGAASLGANWALEVSSGPIESTLPFSAAVQTNWSHVLVPPTVDLDTVAGGNDHAFTFTDGDLATSIVGAVSIADVDDATLVNVKLSISGVLNGAAEELTIGDLTFALNADNFTNTAVDVGGAIYTVDWVKATGVATITLNSGEMTIVQAEAVLVATLYQHTSDTPNTTGNRTIAVTVNDGDSDSAAATTTITLLAINDEPTLTTTGTNSGLYGGGTPIGIFSGTSISTVESGESITGITITVSNVVPPNNGFEILNIDGTSITLDDGLSGSTTNFAYSVTRTSNIVTVALSGGSVTPAALESIVDGATYQHDDTTPGGSSRTFEITQLVDDGGTADGGDNTNDLTGQTSVVSVAGANAAVVTGAGGTLAYTEWMTPIWSRRPSVSPVVWWSARMCWPSPKLVTSPAVSMPPRVS